MATSGAGSRLVTLDVIRGIAVMGIFSVNVVAMAMITSAYFYPPAYGFHSLGDRIMWLANFIFIDGKMRSLFSMLFGASMLLVIERAEASGLAPARVHYARMVVLLLFGLLHFTLLWWGDILTLYAAVGMLAFLFWKLPARWLLGVAMLGFVIFSTGSIHFTSQGFAQYEAATAPNPSPEATKRFEEQRRFLHPNAKELAKDRSEHANPVAHFKSVVPERIIEPFDFGPLWIETLGLMLLGMAGYKSGFLTGQWSDANYRRAAAAGLGIGALAYAALGIWVWSSGFRPPESRFAYGGISVPFRPVMALGYAAAIILLFRRPSAIRDRFAAVGRAAFTNYLGATIIGTLVFFGFGGDLYGKVSRAEAWLLVPLVWLVMLAWSKPWLDRFQYGPFEWLWRSLARWELQPLRRRRPATALAPEA